MDNFYLTASDHERYLDSLARSKAMCADKLRHRQCSKEQCKSCDKRQLLDACEAELAPYSRLLLKDKAEIEAGKIAAAHPTLDEVEDAASMEREARRSAFIQVQKDLSWEAWHSGGWIGVAALIIVPILFPVLGCMEWFL